jgi:hypothetical protein
MITVFVKSTVRPLPSASASEQGPAQHTIQINNRGGELDGGQGINRGGQTTCKMPSDEHPPDTATENHETAEIGARNPSTHANSSKAILYR